ncbi:MAG: endonuclease/exonuclease/phosphatase family protein, partial [Bacteroidota bacterium]
MHKPLARTIRFLLGFFLLSVVLKSHLAAQIPQLEIWEIQGTEAQSPFRNQEVQTNSNIVTYVGFDFFAIQTPEERSDNNVLSSDGLIVVSGSHTLELGDVVSISGFVRESDGQTLIDNVGLQISVEDSDQALPPAVELNESFPSPIRQNLPDMERVEGMLVDVPIGMANGPANSLGLPLVASEQRIFREAGIPFPGINGLPVWDNNPELLYLLPINEFWQPLREASGGNLIQTSGLLFEDEGRYLIRPQSLNIEGGLADQAVRDKTEDEVSIGSLNCLTFFRGTDNFDNRLNKLATYILFQMKAPDILAVQEVENELVLERLGDAIENLDSSVQYQAMAVPINSGSFPINNGYLVRRSLQNASMQLLGEAQQMSTGGGLHNRPPLLLEAEWPTDPPTPIRVLNLHMRSLNGIEGDDAFFVRLKRHEQGISVARMIQSLRSQNLIVLGDMNAYEFSDGYVDILSQISGQPSLGSEFPVNPIVNPPLTNHSAEIAAQERYSFIFRGNLQLLDHCLSNELEGMQVKELAYARGNSDNPEFSLSSPDQVLRASDHDGLVLFLELDNPVE